MSKAQSVQAAPANVFGGAGNGIGQSMPSRAAGRMSAAVGSGDMAHAPSTGAGPMRSQDSSSPRKSSKRMLRPSGIKELQAAGSSGFGGPEQVNMGRSDFHNLFGVVNQIRDHLVELHNHVHIWHTDVHESHSAMLLAWQEQKDILRATPSSPSSPAADPERDLGSNAAGEGVSPQSLTASLKVLAPARPLNQRVPSKESEQKPKKPDAPVEPTPPSSRFQPDSETMTLNYVSESGSLEDVTDFISGGDSTGQSGQSPQGSAAVNLFGTASQSSGMSEVNVTHNMPKNPRDEPRTSVGTIGTIAETYKSEAYADPAADEENNFTSFGDRFKRAKQAQAQRLSIQWEGGFSLPPSARGSVASNFQGGFHMHSMPGSARGSVAQSPSARGSIAQSPSARGSIANAPASKSALAPIGRFPMTFITEDVEHHEVNKSEEEDEQYVFDFFTLDEIWDEEEAEAEETKLQELQRFREQSSATSGRKSVATLKSMAAFANIGKRTGTVTFDDFEEEKGFFEKLAVKATWRPGGYKRLTWDFLLGVVLALEAIATPFNVCFDPPFTELGILVASLSVAFWSVDLVLNFISGYSEYGGVVMDPYSIARRYITGWFFPDVVLLGLECVSTFARPSLASGQRAIRLLRAVLMLRLCKLSRVVGDVSNKLASEYLTVILAIVFKIFLTLLVTHWFACGWYFMGTLEEGSSSHPTWLYVAQKSDDSLLDNYLLSFHWAVAQVHGDMEEVHPQNNLERVYAVIVLLLALFAFTVFIGNFASLLGNLWSGQVFKARQFWLLRQYLKQMNVSLECAGKVEAYLKHILYKREQEIDVDEVVILNYLSKPLRDDLKAESYASCVCKHRLFAYLCYEKEHGLSHLVGAFATLWLSAHDFVFLCGDSLESMVFFIDGNGEYHLDSGQKSDIIKTVQAGQWVSEPVLWVAEWIGLGDLEVCDACQVVTINAEDFKVSVRSRTGIMEVMRKYAKQFLQMLNKVEPKYLSDIMYDNLSPEDVLLESDLQTEEFMEALQKSRTSWFAPVVAGESFAPGDGHRQSTCTRQSTCSPDSQDSETKKQKDGQSAQLNRAVSFENGCLPEE